MNINHWIYDLESYPNIFTMCVIRADGGHVRKYEVSERKNDTEGILSCLRWMIANKQTMVGFNNLDYDYPMLHYIMMQATYSKKIGEDYRICAKEMYDKTQELIGEWNPFKNRIHQDEEIIRQIDLHKIHHFDNAARMTSLKMLEFNMRSDNISDLPFEVGLVLDTDNMKNELLTYNEKDVTETLKFYNNSYGMIEFREELSDRFGFDCTNMNDSKIGSEYFISRIEKVKRGSCYTYTKTGKRVRNTKRESINLGECILPYVKFETPEFNSILDWIKKQTITETKGVFTNIEEHLLGDVAKYCPMRSKREHFRNPLFKNSKGVVTPKNDWDMDDDQHVEELNRLKERFIQLHPKGFFEESPTTKTQNRVKVIGVYREAPNLITTLDGFDFVFGTGGIHGCIESGVVEETEEIGIRDYDVKSYYPNLSINNKVYPEHLGEVFCGIYKDLYIERGGYAKKTAMNEAIKLALNGTYGNSNSEFSPFYDPKFTMTITINGQLSLCMLVEQLRKRVRNFGMIQANTDGITFTYNREDVKEMEIVIREWEETTKLVMEHVDYKRMIVADVNNYICEDVDGGIKRKGRYEYDGLGWHQNHSALVIKKAAEQFLLYGKCYKEYITSHKDVYDFMLRTKVDRSSRLELVRHDAFGGVDSVTPLQNICRYYPSDEGGQLVKIMPPLKGGDEERRFNIESKWKMQPCNDMSDFKNDINYDYYIEEVEKLISFAEITEEE